MSVVIDTNVFVSSLFGGNPRNVINLWKEEKITLCLSNEILEEYIDVLERIAFRHKQELKDLLSLFSTGFNLIFTTETPTINVFHDDPDDDKFIESAVALNADVIVTGDKAMLELKKYGNISIMTPKNFLEKFPKG